MVSHNYGKMRRCLFLLHRIGKTWILLEPTYHSWGRPQKLPEPEALADTERDSGSREDNKARVPGRKSRKNCQTYQKNFHVDSMNRLGSDPDIGRGYGF